MSDDTGGHAIPRPTEVREAEAADVLLAVTKLGEHTGQCPLCGELLPHEDNTWGGESLGHASDCLALRAAAALEGPTS